MPDGRARSENVLTARCQTFQSEKKMKISGTVMFMVLETWIREIRLDSELRLSTVASSLRSVLFLARRPFALRSDLLEAIKPVVL
ncbi:hypothetical protein TNCV_224781 [Trichonephila clavipes]|nr:hypothetical protein TNCV_224781 [Trichonephila clavipes]